MHPQRGEMEFDSIGISKLGLKGRQDIAGGEAPCYRQQNNTSPEGETGRFAFVVKTILNFRKK